MRQPETSSLSNSTKPRVDWYDFARGASIILVVLFHTGIALNFGDDFLDNLLFFRDGGGSIPIDLCLAPAPRDAGRLAGSLCFRKDLSLRRSQDRSLPGRASNP